MKELRANALMSSLMCLSVEEWKMPKHREKLEDKVLYVICEENCFRITMLQCETVSDLTST